MKTALQLIGGFALLIALSFAYLYLPLQWRRHKDIELGNHIIANIAQFQKTHGRLPENTKAELLPLGFRHNKQGWQPNYIRRSTTAYELRYQDGFVPPYLRWQSGCGVWEWAQ